MTNQSKVAILSIIGLIAVFLPLYLSSAEKSATAELSEQIVIWAQFFVWLLALTVGLGVLITVSTEIISRIRNKEGIFQDSDERDLKIEAASVRNFCYVFAAGFFASMIFAAFFTPLVVLFHILAFTYLTAGLTLNLSYIFHYQRGY